MNTIGNIIVGMWFIPVTLFIFIPLAFLGVDLLLNVIKKLTGKTREVREHHHIVGHRV